MLSRVNEVDGENLQDPPIKNPGYANVSPIIRPPYSAAAAGLLLWAGRARDIDRLLHGRRSAANASSVVTTGDVRSRTQTCYSKQLTTLYSTTVLRYAMHVCK